MTNLQKMLLIYLAVLIAMIGLAVFNSAHAHPGNECHLTGSGHVHCN